MSKKVREINFEIQNAEEYLLSNLKKLNKF